MHAKTTERRKYILGILGVYGGLSIHVHLWLDLHCESDAFINSRNVFSYVVTSRLSPFARIIAVND